jgi:hypothetical protein
MFRRGFFILALLALFLFPEKLFAMRLEPDSSDVLVTPGQLTTAKVLIENDQSAKESYAVTFSEVLFGDDAQALQFSPLGEQEAWFKADPSSFTLAPHEKKEVTVQIMVPGEVRASKAVAVLVEEIHDGEGIGVTSAGASLFFLHIGEGLLPKFSIRNFTASRALTTSPRADLSLLVENTGDDTGVFSADIVVKNMFGGVVDRYPFSEREKRIPAEGMRSFALTWPRENGFNRLLLGEYSFSLVQGERELAATSVTILPWPAILVLFFVLVLLVLGILMKVRRGR